MMILALPDVIEDLAARQLRLVTRDQLRDAGISAAMVRRRLVSQWRLPVPGVVHLGRAHLTGDQRLVAAQLVTGPGAVLTGAAACRWYGLENVESRGVDMLVPIQQASRQLGFVRAWRTDRPPQYSSASGLVRIAPAARAVADACRQIPVTRTAQALVIEAVQTRTVRLVELVDELHAGPRRHSASLRAAITAAETGAWSAPEHDLGVICRSSKVLPVPWCNPVLRTSSGRRLPSPDLWLDRVGLAIQVHSHRHHASGKNWDRTIQADSALAEAGVLRLSVTPHEIATDPSGVLLRIETLYVSMDPAARPAVTATPREV